MKSPILWIAMAVAGVGAAAIIQAHTPAGAGNRGQATDSAYRDGVYLGELAARQGENPRIASGRWATQANRQSFAAGYEKGYASMAHNSMIDRAVVATNAAYRDGLYLGKLDAENGNDQHIAGGRWSKMEDRSLFADGYRASYNQVVGERGNTGSEREAMLEQQ